MKKIHITLLSTFVCGAFLFLIQACKRDHWPCPNCPSKPICQVSTHQVVPGSQPGPEGPAYPEGFQFTRTFGPDGQVNYMHGYLYVYNMGWSGYQRLKGTVHHTANRLFVLDSAMDTTLVADLSSDGRPVTMILNVAPDLNPPGTFTYKYYYDQNRRLIKLVNRVVSPDTTNGTVFTFKYDQYNNVTRIESSFGEGFYLKFNYDYKKPIKGGYYELGGFPFEFPEGLLYMQYLGHLNTLQAHHLLAEVSSGYPQEMPWSYYDQKVNADGYLESYKSDLYNRDYRHIEAKLIWNCGTYSGPKY